MSRRRGRSTCTLVSTVVSSSSVSWDPPCAPLTQSSRACPPRASDFEYLTPRKRLEPNDLPPRLRTAQYLHFVCSPTRALVIAAQLSPSFSPSLVYEPIPDRCTPDELPALREVLPLVRVFSPNHEEAAAFFGLGPEEVARGERGGIEDTARRFLDLGAADVVLIRSGPLGAYAVRRGQEENGVWVPAYHSYADGRATGKVVDVTGAGNSFLVRARAVSRPVTTSADARCAAGRTHGGSGAPPGRPRLGGPVRLHIGAHACSRLGSVVPRH